MRVLAYFISLFVVVTVMLAIVSVLQPVFGQFHRMDAMLASMNPAYGSFDAEPNELIIPDVNGTDYTANVVSHYDVNATSKVYDVHARVWVFTGNLSGKCIFIVPEGYDIGIRNETDVIYVYNSGTYGYKVYSPWEEVYLSTGEYWWGTITHPKPGSSVISFVITVAPWFTLFLFFGMLAVFIYTKVR